MNRYYTIKEICYYLKVSRDTVYKWRKAGMPYKKVGGSIRFDPEEVNAWIEAGATSEEKTKKTRG